MWVWSHFINRYSIIIIIAITLLTSGYIIQQHMTVVSHSKYYQLVAKLPASFFIMAMLIWAIKPDFNLMEV